MNTNIDIRAICVKCVTNKRFIEMTSYDIIICKVKMKEFLSYYLGGLFYGLSIICGSFLNEFMVFSHPNNTLLYIYLN